MFTKYKSAIITACAIALALIASPFMVNVARASTWNVSVDFEIVSDYPSGWDGVPGCMDSARSPVAGGGAGTVAVRNGHTETALQNVAHPELWLTLHRHLYQSVTVAVGGFEFASAAMGNHAITDVWMVACNGSTLVYSHDWQQTGFDSHVSGSNTDDIIGASDLYLYAMACYTCSPPETAGLHSASITIDSDVNPFVPGEGGGLEGGPFRPITLPSTITLSDDHKNVLTRDNASVHSISDGVIASVQHFPLGWTVKVAPIGATVESQYLEYDHLQAINGIVGDSVTGGCVLGQATTVFDNANGKFGDVLLNGPDDIMEAWPDYANTLFDVPCDANKYKTENCVNLNPNFADLSKNWNLEGHVEDAPGGGLTIYSDADVYQDVSLNSENTYIVTIYGTTALGNTSALLRVTFGGAQADLHLIVPYANGPVKVESQTLSPGTADYAPSTYRLKIKNVAPLAHLATPVIIRFACIGTDAPQSAPEECYWGAATIAGMQTDDWSHDEDVTYQAPPGFEKSGAYTVPATSAIWRNVDISAFEDRDTKFTLTVFSSNGINVLSPPYGRWHAFIRNHDTLETIQDIGSWDTLPGIVTIQHTQFALTEGEHVVGDLVIQNTSNDIDSTGWNQDINNACLSVEGGIWPSYENVDVGTVTCPICTQPENPDAAHISVENLLSWVGRWLQYGWCYLGYILQCVLWQSILNIITGIGQFGRWLSLTIAAFAAWGADGARFAFSNLQAWAIPILNQMIAWLFSLPFIQSVVDTVSIATMWLQAFLDIIIAIFNLFGLLVQLIGALLNLVGVAWTAFSAAVSGSTTTTFPFPNCHDSSSFLYDACLILDIANSLFGHVVMLGILVNAAALSMAWHFVRWSKMKAEEAMSN